MSTRFDKGNHRHRVIAQQLFQVIRHWFDTREGDLSFGEPAREGIEQELLALRQNGTHDFDIDVSLGEENGRPIIKVVVGGELLTALT